MKAKVIKEVLQDHGFVLADVARKLGVSPQHLNNIFMSPDIKVGTVLKFVRVTGLPLTEFLVSCEEIRESDSQFKELYNKKQKQKQDYELINSESNKIELS